MAPAVQRSLASMQFLRLTWRARFCGLHLFFQQSYRELGGRDWNPGPKSWASKYGMHNTVTDPASIKVEGRTNSPKLSSNLNI